MSSPRELRAPGQLFDSHPEDQRMIADFEGEAESMAEPDDLARGGLVSPKSDRAGSTAMSPEEVERRWAEAEERGRQEPGRITMLVPGPRRD